MTASEARRCRLGETLAQTWAQRGIVPPAIAVDETALATPPPSTQDTLPGLLDDSTGRALIQLGAILGEGGMGIVFEATQTVLGRTVAVKTLRADRPAPADAQQLLREGRVTGLLEHPNVVPVHNLGRDERGRPLIVMKRIDGTPWSSMLAGVPIAERGEAAFLREHLGILQQVTSALHFAHAAGILHRDIKPDNVMVGPFGEVYLVDWGIAVCISERHVSNVPRASGVRLIEGTPVYMAPEMAAGAGEMLGVHSDVYLLGATLHELIAGTPPHDGDDIRDVLERAFASVPPTYDEGVPEELGAIARRALAREPGDRYPSAAAFGEAIESFLEHWGSHELCVEGERRTNDLETLPREPHTEEEVERLFHEARFAFTQALRSWPDNERAQAGHRRLLERMIAFELRRGGARAAQSLLRQHDAPPPAVAKRVNDAVERLEALERDVDPRFGIRERLLRVYLGAAAWVLTSFGAGYLTRSEIYVVDHVSFATVGSTFLVGSIVSIIHWRQTTLANATNRAVAGTGLMVFALSVVTWPLLGHMGLSMAHTTVVMAMVNGALWATLLGHLGRPWLPVPLGHLVASVVAWWLPELHFEIFGAFSGATLLWAARRMRRAAESGQAPSSTRLSGS